MTLNEAVEGKPTAPGFYVYEFWGPEGCIYVGRVGDNGPGTLKRRFGGHVYVKPWWAEVDCVLVDAFSSHEEIVAEETRRIAELRPRENRTNGTGGPWLPDVDARRKAYQHRHNQTPDRVAKERAREKARDRDQRDRTESKRLWGVRRRAKPAPGQAALF